MKLDETLYSTVFTELREEFPEFRLVKKSESRTCLLIDFVLLVLTLGKMSEFMSVYTTTLGYTIFTPSSWESMSQARKAVVLRHERIHMRQRRKCGMLLFSLLYLFLPIPILFSYFRMKFEKEAYEETIRAQKEYYGVEFLRMASTRQAMVSRFTGPSYLWMWVLKSSIEKWYDGRVEK